MCPSCNQQGFDFVKKMSRFRPDHSDEIRSESVLEIRSNLCSTSCPLLEVCRTGRPLAKRVVFHRGGNLKVPLEIRVAPFPLNDSGLDDESTSQVDDLRRRLKLLEQLALVDELTGLFNRRHINKCIEAKIAELKRFEHRLFSVVFFDLDEFKEINDSYGHHVGDEVLKMVAAALKTGIRADDMAGRWGGDEFIVIGSVATPACSVNMARRIKILIEGSRVNINGGEPLGVTISMGVTTLRPEDSGESVIQRVDELLYRSKRNGRCLISSDF